MKNIKLTGITSFGITVDGHAHVHLIATDHEGDQRIDVDMDPSTAGTVGMLLDSSADAAWKAMVHRAS